MRVAAVQFEPQSGSRADNLGRLLRLTEDAADRGCRLAVWPEMATSGYCWRSREEVRPLAEPVPGPTTQAVARLAARRRITVVAALPERAGEHVLYNSAVIITPAGDCVAYRKVHPFLADPHWAAAGTAFRVVGTPAGALGAAICMDLLFPETGLVLAALGAQLICAPVNWFGDTTPSDYWRVRCRETGLPGVFANRWGEERGVRFAGGSAVISARGEVCARAPGGDGLAVADLELPPAGAKAASVMDTPTARRDLAGLLLDPCSWDPRKFHRAFEGLSPLPHGGPGALVALSPGAGGLADCLEQLAALADEPRPDGHTVVALLPRIAAVNQGAVLDRLHGPIADRPVVALGAVSGPYPTDRGIFFALGPGALRRFAPAPPDAGAVIMDTPIARVAFLSAAGAASPVTRRSAALGGADLLLIPGAGEDRLPPAAVLRVGAAENNCYLAATGIIGPEDTGPPGGPAAPGALVCGPDLFALPGLLARAALPESATAVIDLDTRRDVSGPGFTVTRKPLLALRRTCAYGPLAGGVGAPA